MLQIFCHTIVMGIPSLFPIQNQPLIPEAPLYKICRQLKTQSSLTEKTSYHNMNEESFNEDDNYVLLRKLPVIANLATDSNINF